ncbi:MAG: HlyD family efflux transporter periplasmic adaptor subunit, partial [Xanthomonadales bacterium]|nr:HlyD family efflux transporter periplasmic adaptor subunit [Xanthomonadales bacterium]
QEIFDRGLSDRATLDNADTRARTTAAEADAAREALAALLSGTTVEELQQAEAALRAAEAAVRQAGVDLERLSLRAPVAGRLDQVLAEPGERPVPGETLAVLLDGSRLYARLYVPEPLRATITPGTRLQVTVDGRDPPLDATVRWVSADASFTPYFALTEHDRSRLAYLAEADFAPGTELPAGVPLEAELAATPDPR